MKDRLGITKVAGMLLLLLASTQASAQFSLLPTPSNNSYVTTGTQQDALGVSHDAYFMNGVPIALKYDDFWSYSAKLLNAIQSGPGGSIFLPTSTYGTYDFVVGTGVINVLLDSRSGQPNAIDITGDNKADVYLQNSVNLNDGNKVGWQGVWGGTTQVYFNTSYASNDGYTTAAETDPTSVKGVGTTSTVGEMLDILNFMSPGATIPVLYADYNQTGASPSIFLSAKVEIWSPNSVWNASTNTFDGTLLDIWTLDNEVSANNSLNATSPTFNFAHAVYFGFGDTTNSPYDNYSTRADAITACISTGYNAITGEGCVGVSENGTWYEWDANTGSGKPDFLAFSYDMDLSRYARDNLIVFTANIGCWNGIQALNAGTGGIVGCNDDGGEEFGVLYAFAPNQVPEPGSLALLGIGFSAFGWRLRRRLS